MLTSSTRSAPLLLAGLVALVFALAPSTVQAQISSDRPGLGDGATVIAPGTFQAELGYQLGQASLADIDVTTHSIGQLFLRYGVTDYLEVRGGVGSIGVASSDAFAENLTGYVGAGQGSGNFGTTLGAKLRLLDAETATLSGLASVSAPTLSGDFETSDDRARQEVKFILDAALGSNLSLTVNGGSTFFWSSGFQDDRAVEWLFIPTLNIPINEKVGTYVGYGGFYTDGENTNFVEAGLTLLATPDTQLDVNGGFRVDDNVDSQFFLGVGLAQRF